MEFIQHYDSPLGGITLSARDGALTGLWFDGQKFFMDTLKDTAAAELPVRDIPEEERRVLQLAAAWLDIYFAGRDPGFTPPLDPAGSPFRRAVWKELLAIPYGEVRTYGQIAYALRAAGIQTAPRAVGGAVGHNPVSLIIPCHRVVGSDGKLTGYAGGTDRKQWLLELEGAEKNRYKQISGSGSGEWK